MVTLNQDGVNLITLLLSPTTLAANSGWLLHDGRVPNGAPAAFECEAARPRGAEPELPVVEVGSEGSWTEVSRGDLTPRCIEGRKVGYDKAGSER